MESWFAVRIVCFFYLALAFLIVILTYISCYFAASRIFSASSKITLNTCILCLFSLSIHVDLSYYSKKDSKTNITMDKLGQVNTQLRQISQFWFPLVPWKCLCCELTSRVEIRFMRLAVEGKLYKVRQS